MNSIRHTQEQLYVTPKIGYVDCDAENLLRHLATSPLGNNFCRHSRFSPKQPETQTHGDFNVSFLKQQTRLLQHYGENISLARPTTRAAFFSLS